METMKVSVNKYQNSALSFASTYRNSSDRGVKDDSSPNGTRQNQGDGIIKKTLSSNPLIAKKLEPVSYAETLRMQRVKKETTTLAVKKMRYNFKSLSSKILRSKTSSAARQAAAEARRQVIRLKRLASQESEDTEEIQAEIAHAKAMERVAKKKANNLEMEEMARAASGIFGGIKLEDTDEPISEQEGALYLGDEQISEEEVFNEEAIASGQAKEEAFLEISQEELMRELQELSAESMSMEGATLENLTLDLFEEVSEDMLAVMEELGLEVMETVDFDNLEPQDLKEMKIKHRNKEMKEIVQADSEYLKAMFKVLADKKANPQSAIRTVSAPSVGVISATGASLAVNVTIHTTGGSEVNVGVMETGTSADFYV